MAQKRYGSDFWDFESFANNVQKGDIVLGVVNGQQDYGVFVTLGDSLNALIPSRYVSKNSNVNSRILFPVGRWVNLVVQQIDCEKKRITLSSTDFAVGEKVARRSQLEVDYNEPIDNSKVEISPGDKELCFQIPDQNDEKFGARAYRVLATSIKMMKNDAPYIADFFSEMPDLGEQAEYIIEHSFTTSMPTQIFLRNLTFEGKKGADVRRLGFRLVRQEGDFWDTETKLPLNRTFLFEGKIIDSGRVFCVDKIFLVANSEDSLPYEVSFEIINVESASRIRWLFINDLLDKMVSFTKYTSKKLSLWTDYLDWSQKVAELQIKGVKYVNVTLDRVKRQLVFCLMFRNEAEFKQMQRILRRQEIMAFPNDISTDRYSFKYDGGDGRRKWVRSIDLGNSMGINGETFGLAEAVKKISIPESRNNDGDMSTLYLSDIEENIAKPIFVYWNYMLNDDDSDSLDSILDENGEIINDSVNKVDSLLSKYPKEGFLALSAVGELALINRFKRAIDQVKNGESFNPHLQEWLFDVKQVRLPDSENQVQITRWLNSNVANNPNQREAIEKMLRTKDLFLLQGPPGTGKTTVIAEAIFQFAIRGDRVLLSSQSNDAVDNALGRLVKTPEIRAVRLINSKRRHNSKDDDTLDNLSEDNALRYYYESLSHKISEQTLNKWTRQENAIEEFQNDLRSLNSASERIEKYRNQLQENGNSISQLQLNLDYAKHDWIQAKNFNENLNVEQKHQEYFVKALEGEDVSYALSREQLSVVETIASELNDSDYVLFESSSKELTDAQKNQYVEIFVQNIRQLKLCEKAILSAINNKSVGDDLKLKRLQLDLQKITDQMNSASSDDEYEDLQQQQNALNKQIRNLKKSSQVIDASLNDVQKTIIGKNLQKVFDSDKTAFLDSIVSKNRQVDETIIRIKEELEIFAKSRKPEDVKSIEDRIKTFEGRISTAEEKQQEIRVSLNVDQGIRNALAKKYNVAEPKTESIASAIEKNLKGLQKEYRADKIIRDDFGELLRDFCSTLEKHSKDSRLLQGDNDNYLGTYINSCNVVGFSCTADPSILMNKNIHDFDVVIIDEVSKATPPELLLPLMKAQKVVLVGDHRQLPPMFKTKEHSYEEIVAEIADSDDYTSEEKEALSMDNFKHYEQMVTSSLFKEYFEKAPKEIKSSLLTQYRMHENIMAIINRFYDGQLVCGIREEEMESRKAHGLTIKTCANRSFVTPEKHAFWIDSTNLPDGTPVYESFVGASPSPCNYLEENIIIALLRKIDDVYFAQGNKERKVSVGVISFYQTAVNNLRRKIRRERFRAIQVSTNTVDRFQGQEKNIVIASLVRSKAPGPDGKVRISKHVLAFERINVAFSRAQNLLFIVGAKKTFEELNVTLPMMDSAKTRTAPVYKNIMADLHRNGCLVDSSCVIDDSLAKKILKECGDAKNRANTRNRSVWKKDGRK